MGINISAIGKGLPAILGAGAIILAIADVILPGLFS